MTTGKRLFYVVRQFVSLLHARVQAGMRLRRMCTGDGGSLGSTTRLRPVSHSISGLARVAIVVLLAVTVGAGTLLATVRTARAASPAGIDVTIQGKTYQVTPGQTLKFPTTYSNGAKGWVEYSVGFVAGQPLTSGCRTASGWEAWYNALGGVLVKYTVNQHWCYDGTHVTSYGHAYYSEQNYNGWTFVNHYEETDYYPYPQYNPDEGVGFGQFRFNGPLGFGCESGEIVIDFYGNGAYPSYDFYGGFYGC